MKYFQMTVIMNQLANGLRNFTLHADHEQNQLCLQCAWKTSLFILFYVSLEESGRSSAIYSPSKTFLVAVLFRLAFSGPKLIGKGLLGGTRSQLSQRILEIAGRRTHGLTPQTLPKTLLKPIRGDQRISAFLWTVNKSLTSLNLGF